MGRIETLIILPVASFHLPVVAWGKGADEFVADPVEFQMFLEQGRLFVARGKTVGKLCAIISLNAFDWTREGLYQMFYKLGGRNRCCAPQMLPQNASGSTRQWPCTGKTVFQ